MSLPILILVFEMLQSFGGTFSNQIIPVSPYCDSDFNFGLIQKLFQINSVTKEVMHPYLIHREFLFLMLGEFLFFSLPHLIKRSFYLQNRFLVVQLVLEVQILIIEFIRTHIFELVYAKQNPPLTQLFLQQERPMHRFLVQRHPHK